MPAEPVNLPAGTYRAEARVKVPSTGDKFYDGAVIANLRDDSFKTVSWAGHKIDDLNTFGNLGYFTGNGSNALNYYPVTNGNVKDVCIDPKAERFIILGHGPGPNLTHYFHTFLIGGPPGHHYYAPYTTVPSPEWPYTEVNLGNFAAPATQPRAFDIDESGRHMVLQYDDAKLEFYYLRAPWDVQSRVLVRTVAAHYTVIAGTSPPSPGVVFGGGCSWGDGGRVVYLRTKENGADKIYAFRGRSGTNDPEVPFDPEDFDFTARDPNYGWETIGADGSISTGAQGFSVSPQGDRFVINANNDRRLYTCSAPWRLQNATLTSTWVAGGTSSVGLKMQSPAAAPRLRLKLTDLAGTPFATGELTHAVTKQDEWQWTSLGEFTVDAANAGANWYEISDATHPLSDDAAQTYEVDAVRFKRIA